MRVISKGVQNRDELVDESHCIVVIQQQQQQQQRQQSRDIDGLPLIILKDIERQPDEEVYLGHFVNRLR